MQGLVAYEESDEDEKPKSVPTKVNGSHAADSANVNALPTNNPSNADTQSSAGAPANGPAQGPAQGPSMEPTADSPPPSNGAPPTNEDPSTTTRRQMQSLTLPPVPHISIPPSPPGSPDPATTAKVQRFLDLKAQGVHLNETLASKPALRNPSMFSNLMDFAGIGEREAYASALPPELQVGGPEGFAEGMFVESLEAERRRGEGVRKGGVGFTKGSVAGSKRVRE